jgi:hypothetical protein
VVDYGHLARGNRQNGPSKESLMTDEEEKQIEIDYEIERKMML